MSGQLLLHSAHLNLTQVQSSSRQSGHNKEACTEHPTQQRTYQASSNSLNIRFSTTIPTHHRAYRWKWYYNERWIFKSHLDNLLCFLRYIWSVRESQLLWHIWSVRESQFCALINVNHHQVLHHQNVWVFLYFIPNYNSFCDEILLIQCQMTFFFKDTE